MVEGVELISAPGAYLGNYGIHVPKGIFYNILRTEFWLLEFKLKKLGFCGPQGPFLAKNAPTKRRKFSTQWNRNLKKVGYLPLGP